MSRKIESNELLVKPVYRQKKINEVIQLGQHQIKYSCQEKEFFKNADVRIDFGKNSTLVFHVEHDSEESFFHGMELMHGFDNKITLVASGIEIDAFCLRSGSSGIDFQPKQSRVTPSVCESNLQSAIFHLFNFPSTHGPDNYILHTSARSSLSCGRILLNGGGWSIDISALEETRELNKELKRNGGYVLTHAGRITRTDGSGYSVDELEQVLSTLQYFLSAFLGRWYSPDLVVGFDEKNTQIFQTWGIGRTSPAAWQNNFSCFDEMHAELLTDLFANFFDLFVSEIWNTTLRHAVYWYLAANERGHSLGVDAGLILAQTTLEGIAWNYCVNVRKLVSANAFRKQGGLSTPDKIRLLVGSLNIPSSIPSVTNSLIVCHLKSCTKSRCSCKKWVDCMDAMVSVRNSLVHADASTEYKNLVYYDAWRLSLWMIDLILLRLCSYQGKFADRLHQKHVGAVISVPWA